MTIPIALRTVVQFIPQPPLTRSMRVYPLGWLMGDVSRIITASSATSLGSPPMARGLISRAIVPPCFPIDPRRRRLRINPQAFLALSRFLL
jgi:hypothetical protein